MLQEEIAALNKAGIYELRIILRDLGGTPSTKAKSQLIKEIVEITDNGAAPERSPRGRKPAKSSIKMSGAVKRFEQYRSGESDAVMDHGRAVYGESITGVVFLCPEGHGYVYAVGNVLIEDIYLPSELVAEKSLRHGDTVRCHVVWNDSTRLTVDEVIDINDMPSNIERPNFDVLTSCYPSSKFNLSSPVGADMFKLMNVLCPLGKGQRGLVVSQTIDGGLQFLKSVANTVAENNTDAVVIASLIDERPEEITEFRRSVKAELICSPFDQGALRHAQIAELAVSKGKRIAEMGGSAIVLLNSLSKLISVYDEIEQTHADAILRAKKLFGAARNTEESGSLTLIATVANVDDAELKKDLQQFFSMSNMEVYLCDGDTAVDFSRSRTMRDGALLTMQERLVSAACLKAIENDDVDAAIACIEG